jgi:hypothetical protein
VLAVARRTPQGDQEIVIVNPTTPAVATTYPLT